MLPLATLPVQFAVHFHTSTGVLIHTLAAPLCSQLSFGSQRRLGVQEPDNLMARHPCRSRNPEPSPAVSLLRLYFPTPGAVTCGFPMAQHLTSNSDQQQYGVSIVKPPTFHLQWPCPVVEWRGDPHQPYNTFSLTHDAAYSLRCVRYLCFHFSSFVLSSTLTTLYTKPMLNLSYYIPSDMLSSIGLFLAFEDKV